ncbi:hypothetical protein EVAR_9034_1 [Eumeta japonica]|uniref:Uncharacterized protein n=1 Tax=Eumeta variegata TaxID=151549 RepID=A0A4C1TVW8_EUMVA|nr:hypothetical protein EVAR_9034_1 [Eumeta japonica]
MSILKRNVQTMKILGCNKNNVFERSKHKTKEPGIPSGACPPRRDGRCGHFSADSAQNAETERRTLLLHEANED